MTQEEIKKLREIIWQRYYQEEDDFAWERFLESIGIKPVSTNTHFRTPKEDWEIRMQMGMMILRIPRDTALKILVLGL